MHVRDLHVNGLQTLADPAFAEIEFPLGDVAVDFLCAIELAFR